MGKKIFLEIHPHTVGMEKQKIGSSNASIKTPLHIEGEYIALRMMNLHNPNIRVFYEFIVIEDGVYKIPPHFFYGQRTKTAIDTFGHYWSELALETEKIKIAYYSSLLLRPEAVKEFKSKIMLGYDVIIEKGEFLKGNSEILEKYGIAVKEKEE